MKTNLLVYIASLALLSSSHGNALKCKTPTGDDLEAHLLYIDAFYQELRHRAARGGSYQGHSLGPGGQMYALIRNDTLYKMAEKEIETRYLEPGKYGLYRLEDEYESRDSPVDSLVKLLKTDKAVKQQMIYPNATQYACTLQVFINNSSKVCQQKVLCILDKRAPANYQITGTACNKDSDCTYITPAKCLSPLCYSQKTIT